MSPDRWLALTVRPESELDHELLPLLLLDLGGGGIQETEEGFLTYLLPPEDLDGFLDDVRGRVNRLHPGGLEIIWRWQSHQDWAVFWRRGLGPRAVTPRITVAPTWEVPEPTPGRHVILLDPGMAFGTAEHATTRGCLRLLDRRVVTGIRIADVGAGSGILSIAAALLGATSAVALEMDGMSCQVARENARANGVEGKVLVYETLVEAGGALPDAPLDGIVANLQSFLLLPLLSTLRDSLRPGGWLILSGILEEERDAFLLAAEGQGLELEEEDREEEWWTGAFRVPLTPP